MTPHFKNHITEILPTSLCREAELAPAPKAVHPSVLETGMAGRRVCPHRWQRPPALAGRHLSAAGARWQPAELIHAPVPPHHAKFGLSLERQRSKGKTNEQNSAPSQRACL